MRPSLCSGRPDPRRVPDGPGQRSAIYLPFPEALPATYTVDPAHCLQVQEGQCQDGPPCALACPEGAVDFGRGDKRVTLKVGAIIVATGYDPFDPERKPEFGYGRYPGVVSALEFERLAAANGPTGGRIVSPRHGQAAGARCFYPLCWARATNYWATNTAHGCAACIPPSRPTWSLDQLPDARVTAFYMDVRAFTKGGEEFYDRARARGVRYRRGNPSEIYRRGENWSSALRIPSCAAP